MHPSLMEPMLPDNAPLEDVALRVLSGASELGGMLAEETRRGVADVLRLTNCYYSNRIEGHNTHPADIERAMRDDFAEDPTLRILQREARAHIEVQELVEARLDKEPALDITRPEFLTWIHREFYERVPVELQFIEDPENKRREPVIPGAMRHHDVKVGRHLPPEHQHLKGFLDRFSEAYRLGDRRSVRDMVALAASHHRLMWIHPFSDGNGRVARLFSTAYAYRLGLGGRGLWTVSRGLARRRAEYMELLAEADSRRRGDLDGRGNLSAHGLLTFCHFFLDICVDQISYMRSLLALTNLGERLVRYAHLRATGTAPGPAGKHEAALRPETGLLLRAVLLRGTLPRGEAYTVLGLRRTLASQAIKDLLAEGLLVTDSPKGLLRLGFPAHALQYQFPQLFPEGILIESSTLSPAWAPEGS